MRKKIKSLFFLLLLFLPALVWSARICIWHYDPLDRFYDSSVGDSIDCAYWVEEILRSQGHTVEIYTSLPTDLNQYDLVFCLMGWWRCWGDNCTVGPTERQTLITFLNAGKGVYAEGADFGYSNRTNEIWPYFGCLYLGDGNASGVGNVQNLTGQSNTFAQGINLGYLYQQGPDNYVDEIGTNGGTIYFRDQSGIGRAIYYQEGNYRTIFSAVIFGALQGSQRENLMRSYVQYLLSGTGIEEEKRETALKIMPNPVIAKGKVLLQIPEEIKSVRVFNASGQLLKEWHLNSHNQKVILWDFLGANGKRLPAGTYLISASGSYTLTQSLILLP